jgi:Flp pilus assembly protein TadG
MNRRTRVLRGERGQAMVEFALVIPIFLLLVIGVIEFGRAWNLQQTLADASREGARRAAVFDPTLTQATVEAAIRAKIAASGFNPALATITWPTGFAVGMGAPITARIQMPYRFAFLRPLIMLANTSSDGTLTLVSATQMRKE